MKLTIANGLQGFAVAALTLVAAIQLVYSLDGGWQRLEASSAIPAAMERFSRFAAYARAGEFGEARGLMAPALRNRMPEERLRALIGELPAPLSPESFKAGLDEQGQVVLLSRWVDGGREPLRARLTFASAEGTWLLSDLRVERLPALTGPGPKELVRGLERSR